MAICSDVEFPLSPGTPPHSTPDNETPPLQSLLSVSPSNTRQHSTKHLSHPHFTVLPRQELMPARMMYMYVHSGLLKHTPARIHIYRVKHTHYTHLFLVWRSFCSSLLPVVAPPPLPCLTRSTFLLGPVLQTAFGGVPFSLAAISSCFWSLNLTLLPLRIPPLFSFSRSLVLCDTWFAPASLSISESSGRDLVNVAFVGGRAVGSVGAGSLSGGIA